MGGDNVYRQAIDRARELKEQGNAARSIGNYPSAKQCYSAALDLDKSVFESGIEPVVELVAEDFALLGDCSFDEEDYRGALNSYDMAIKIQEKLLRKEETAEGLKTMASYYGRAKEAYAELGDKAQEDAFWTKQADALAKIVTQYPESDEAVQIQSGGTSSKPPSTPPWQPGSGGSGNGSGLGGGMGAKVGETFANLARGKLFITIATIVVSYIAFFLAIKIVTQSGSSGIGSYLVMILCAFFAYWGWRSLDRITPDMFLIMPVANWIIYFCVKLFLSICVGFFVGPYKFGRWLADKVFVAVGR